MWKNLFPQSLAASILLPYTPIDQGVSSVCANNDIDANAAHAAKKTFFIV